MKKGALSGLLLIGLYALIIGSFSSASVNVIPDNDLSIPPLVVKDFETISEQEFNSVTDLLYRIYAPVVKSLHGVDLVMNADWKDATVNAYATREIESWSVHISGGIARAKGMTKDSLALIVCHEIGHHLGGAPRTFLYEGWPSAEGQADYWATSKCMKRYYEELKHEEVSLDNHVPQKVIRDCNNVFKNIGEFKNCVRTMLAAIDFSDFLNALPDTKAPISIEQFDSRQVKGTNTNDYPRPQCRLDTLYQGALCTIKPDVATSYTDATIGHCNDLTRPGHRPRCWYKQQ